MIPRHAYHIEYKLAPVFLLFIAFTGRLSFPAEELELGESAYPAAIKDSFL